MIKESNNVKEAKEVKETKETKTRKKEEPVEKTYIPAWRLSEFIGKKVWYDVLNMFGDGLIAITEIQLSAIDKEHNTIFYKEPVGFEPVGFDYLSHYGKAFVFWEDRPTDEQREKNWKVNSAK